MDTTPSLWRKPPIPLDFHDFQHRQNTQPIRPFVLRCSPITYLDR